MIGRHRYRENYAWKSFGYAIKSTASSLKGFTYKGIFEPPDMTSFRSWHEGRSIPSNAVLIREVDWIVSEEALAPPHGLDVLKPPPRPNLPTLPEIPEGLVPELSAKYDVPKYKKLEAEIASLRTAVAEKIRRERKEGRALATACQAGDSAAIQRLMRTILLRHPLPKALTLDADFAIDQESRIGLCTIEVPDPAKLCFLKPRANSSKLMNVSAAEQKRLPQTMVRSLCIRAAYLAAMGDPGDFFDTVAVNALQKWFDPATGAPREGIVASLQAPKNELRELNPGHLDAAACFRHFAGIATPNVLNAAPIRPVFVMNADDKRIIENKDVASGLDAEANLAAMPWEDFEHLVRQLFEWLFTSEGVEVKVTRASRDRGVDAIAFDPDPIRGGKFVIQAKRYTRPVDVAAVRDLYGTVVNEGANRGILVTTASYGADSYEFAKDKPISLIDGPNLLVLLRKHGRVYRIDLEEARHLEGLT